MQIIDTVAALRERLQHESAISFVPTMGNLHEGHIDLVRQAHDHGTCVVTSIFVNPLQFGPNEDFERYPRTFQSDCDQLAAAGNQVVFAPGVKEMYPVPQQVHVEPSPVQNELCGAHRPGHFRGVATVVLKLFNMVRPQVALFGKKDYQQLFVIREMVSQLNLPVTVIGCETVRAGDGLALSSRNGYLSAAERAEAVNLYRILSEIQEAMRLGNRDFAGLEQEGSRELAGRGWQVDYISIRDAETLLSPTVATRRLVVLGAARLGSTRLIDNLES
jgi:pantoate--beta-alanine ligase